MRTFLVYAAAIILAFFLIGCDTAGIEKGSQNKTQTEKEVDSPEITSSGKDLGRGYDFGLTNDKGFTRSSNPVEKGYLNKNNSPDYVTGFHLTGEVGIYYDRKPNGYPDKFIRPDIRSFGYAFEIFKGKLVVGAPFSESGKVLVYNHNRTQKRTLKCSSCESFGFSISSNENSLAIGAPGNVSGNSNGNVYLYNKNFKEILSLTSSVRYTKLGIRTGFAGKSLIVSSKFYPGPGPEVGKGAIWTIPLSIVGSSRTYYVKDVYSGKIVGENKRDQISSFAVGDFNSDGKEDLAIGSRNYNYDGVFRSNNYMGKVYVLFGPYGSGSVESQADVEIVPYKKSSDESNIGDIATGRFGQSISASDGKLLIGAFNHGKNGKAYVVSNFESDVQWNGFEKELRPSNSSRHREFGRAVVAFDDFYVVGDPSYNGKQRYGSLSIFSR